MPCSSIGYDEGELAARVRLLPYDVCATASFLPVDLQGPAIPKVFQTRLRAMLMLGHISSLSFAHGERHRLITIWANMPVRLQGRGAVGCEVSATHLLPPLQKPKAIPKKAGKAFHQVLQSMCLGGRHSSRVRSSWYRR